MDKEFFDKYSKDLECSCCQDLEYCINGKEPLKINCAIHYFKDKIADLEAKLEESENELAKEKKHINRLKSANKSFDERLDDLIDENKQLKQQLAEKDKEIENHKHHIEWLEDKFVNNVVIAELLDIKEWLEPKYFDNEQINYLSNVIDNRIKELKGDK